MPPFRILPPMVLAGAFAACATTERAPPDQDVGRELALPPAAAAFAVADAVRAALPFSDPVPYAGGAPATRLGPGHYVVRYELRGAQWLPAAEHRLVRSGGEITARATAELPGYGLGADRVLELEIRAAEAAAGAPAATLRGRLRADLLPSFDAALARTMASFVAAPRPALELLRAREFAHAGDQRRARYHRDHALLGSRDAARRAHVLATVAVPRDAADARRHARARLRDDDLSAARALLHTAWRTEPDPGADYEMLWRLHRRLDEGEAALAAALLLREHDALGDGAMIAIEELQNGGLGDLVERMLALAPEYSSVQGVGMVPAAPLPR